MRLLSQPWCTPAPAADTLGEAGAYTAEAILGLLRMIGTLRVSRVFLPLAQLSQRQLRAPQVVAVIPALSGPALRTRLSFEWIPRQLRRERVPFRTSLASRSLQLRGWYSAARWGRQVTQPNQEFGHTWTSANHSIVHSWTVHGHEENVGLREA